MPLLESALQGRSDRKKYRRCGCIIRSYYFLLLCFRVWGDAGKFTVVNSIKSRQVR